MFSISTSPYLKPYLQYSVFIASFIFIFYLHCSTTCDAFFERLWNHNRKNNGKWIIFDLNWLIQRFRCVHCNTKISNNNILFIFFHFYFFFWFNYQSHKLHCLINYSNHLGEQSGKCTFLFDWNYIFNKYISIFKVLLKNSVFVVLSIFILNSHFSMPYATLFERFWNHNRKSLVSELFFIQMIHCFRCANCHTKIITHNTLFT